VDLADHQRALLHLLHADADDAPVAEDDPAYLEQVAASDGLRVLREIIAAWEIYDVRRSCPLTACALEQDGAFEQTIATIRFESTSAYLDARRGLFLDAVARSGEGEIAAVAQFERALHLVRAGDPNTYEIEWGKDPTVIINGLLEHQWLADDAAEGRYRTIVSAQLPGYVAVEPVE